VRVLVDSCVWSLALRRSPAATRHSHAETEAVSILQALVREHRVVLVGPIRQEVLSGIRSETQFELVRERLRAFPDLPLNEEDHELAARHWNRCQRRGIQGSHTDLLLCAVAERHELALLTLDRDFSRFSQVLGTRLVAQANN
jgi:predicted nucleic acid-binding protein